MKSMKGCWRLIKRKPEREEITSLLQGTGYLLVTAWLFYDRVWMAMLLSPYLWFWQKEQEKKREQKRQEQLQRECGEFFQSLTSCLSAGYSLERSLPVIRKELSVLYPEQKSILVKELEKMERQLSMNQRFETLFENMAKKYGNEDLLQFAFILKTAKRRGGNLIQILEKTVQTLRRRNQVEEEIKTILAGRIFEKNIMKAVPFFLIAYLRVFNPDYLSVLYDSIAGNLCMTASLLLMLLAGRIADSIVEIEV